MQNVGVYEVEKFLDVRQKEGCEVQVKWLGIEEPSWEPVEVMLEDLPGMLLEFLSIHKKENATAEYLYHQHVNTKAGRLVVLEYPETCREESEGKETYLSHAKGWTPAEVAKLKQLLRIHGIGRWKEILGEGALPGKYKSQVIEKTKNLNCQRLAEFNGIKGDVDEIKAHNDAIEGFRGDSS